MSGQSFRDYQDDQHDSDRPGLPLPPPNYAALEDEEVIDEYVSEPITTATELLDQSGSVDIDNLPKQKHNWVDRGTVMSCEGADHANHHAYKTRNR